MTKRKKGLLGKLRAKLHRMEAERARSVLEDRKKDTRHKIELGGLIIKAGMGEVDKHILYGGLVELAEKLELPEEHNRLQRRGRRAFFS